MAHMPEDKASCEINQIVSRTCIILRRTDTNEYLNHFEFWDRNSIRWTANVYEAFLFKTHSDAEINGRMVLEWLGDPLNRKVGLMSSNVKLSENEMVVEASLPVNVTRVA